MRLSVVSLDTSRYFSLVLFLSFSLFSLFLFRSLALSFSLAFPCFLLLSLVLPCSPLFFSCLLSSFYSLSFCFFSRVLSLSVAFDLGSVNPTCLSIFATCPSDISSLFEETYVSRVLPLCHSYILFVLFPSFLFALYLLSLFPLLLSTISCFLLICCLFRNAGGEEGHAGHAQGWCHYGRHQR